MRPRLLIATFAGLPATALAHGGPCRDWPWAANALYFGGSALSLLAVIIAPVLAGWWCGGPRWWRITFGVLLAVLGWATAAAIAMLNFMMGMGCPGPWELGAINAAPGVLLGLLVGWLWHRRFKRLARSSQPT